MKEFADNNFKYVENSRKLSECVENTVGKGEISCYEQFLLFPQCFQKACFPGASTGVIGNALMNGYRREMFGEDEGVVHYARMYCNCSPHNGYF